MIDTIDWVMVTGYDILEIPGNSGNSGNSGDMLPNPQLQEIASDPRTGDRLIAHFESSPRIPALPLFSIVEIARAAIHSDTARRFWVGDEMVADPIRKVSNEPILADWHRLLAPVSGLAAMAA